jgi:hypothetical protein
MELFLGGILDRMAIKRRDLDHSSSVFLPNFRQNFCAMGPIEGLS